MSNAWETTVDDVLNVVHKMGKKVSGVKANEIHDALNQFLIEDSALRGNDMDTQTKYAYEEIERQIKEDNLL